MADFFKYAAQIIEAAGKNHLALIALIILLLGVTILIVLIAWQYHRKGTTVIPFYWWVIFIGIMLICQIAEFFIK